MLVEAGLMTEEQLKQAVLDHKRNNMKLGQFLVREGIVASAQITDLISRQLKIRKYHPDDFPIDMGLTEMIPVEMAQRLQAIPLSKTNYLLTLAMTDPTDINALDAIEVHTNMGGGARHLHLPGVEPSARQSLRDLLFHGRGPRTHGGDGGRTNPGAGSRFRIGGPRGQIPARHGRGGAGHPIGQLDSFPGGSRRGQRCAHQSGKGPGPGALQGRRQAPRCAGAA